MKKHYSAPVLYAEAFELCEHIAACQVKGEILIADTCAYKFDIDEFGIISLFGAGSGRACEYDYDEYEDYFNASGTLMYS